VKPRVQHDTASNEQQAERDSCGEVAAKSGPPASRSSAAQRASNQEISVTLRDSIGASRRILTQALVELAHCRSPVFDDGA
jgi:hypothetical protein